MPTEEVFLAPDFRRTVCSELWRPLAYRWDSHRRHEVFVKDGRNYWYQLKRRGNLETPSRESEGARGLGLPLMHTKHLFLQSGITFFNASSTMPPTIAIGQTLCDFSSKAGLTWAKKSWRKPVSTRFQICSCWLHDWEWTYGYWRNLGRWDTCLSSRKGE